MIRLEIKWKRSYAPSRSHRGGFIPPLFFVTF
jgi:hypothetical protein